MSSTPTVIEPLADGEDSGAGSGKKSNKSSRAAAASAPNSSAGYFTRYDFLGLGMAMAIIFHWPRGNEQIYSVLFFMVPAFILLILSLMKVRPLFRRARWAAIPIGAAVFMIVWGFIASIASGAPQVITILGEWGRADGLLTLLACLALTLAVATAPLAQVSRMIAWVIAAGGVALVIGYLTFYFGFNIVGQANTGSFSSTFGNINFSAGFFATTGVLAFFMAFTTRNWFARAALFLYAAGTLVSMVPNGSIQGPLAFAVGIAAAVVALLLTMRGKLRIPGIIVAASLTTFGVILSVLTLAEKGPLGAAFYADSGIVVRKLFWIASFGIVEDYPIFGVGPDGFSRYVTAYRTDEYVQTLGLMGENAVHSVPLHTMVGFGIPGLIAWLLVMAGSLIGLVLFLARIQQTSVKRIGAFGVAVVGGLAAYIAQASVSIDFYSLKMTGWFLAGAAIAVVLRGLEADEFASVNRTQETKAKRRVIPNSYLLGAWVVGLGLAVAGVLLVGWWATLQPYIGNITPAQARDLSTSAWVHCTAREEWSRQLAEVAPEELPSVTELRDTDPRCFKFTVDAASALLSSNDPEAGETVRFWVNNDPKSYIAQGYYAQRLLLEGDLPGAEAARAEMNRLVTIMRVDQIDNNFIDSVNKIIDDGAQPA